MHYNSTLCLQLPKNKSCVIVLLAMYVSPTNITVFFKVTEVSVKIARAAIHINAASSGFMDLIFFV